MTVSKDKIVSIRYHVVDESGNVVDGNEELDPLEYLHGYGNILKGLEDALEGLAENNETKVILTPEEAYGDYDPKMVFEVGKDQFPEGTQSVEAGAIVQSSDGVELLVTKVDGDKITLDANHPLAGKTLHFNIKIEGIREASTTEIEHGHVHSHSGNHH